MPTENIENLIKNNKVSELKQLLQQKEPYYYDRIMQVAVKEGRADLVD